MAASRLYHEIRKHTNTHASGADRFDDRQRVGNIRLDSSGLDYDLDCLHLGVVTKIINEHNLHSVRERSSRTAIWLQ